ncbi:aldo/keto reductase [Cohnella kolymensis]|uniref:Aldo/keto reductase n=1 Tax=Cohnella kolymensis TaxID=1590652 RepID=A0ABR5A727_9BACL|nr:aldo/keto reductase [Cohnella kolymensis]KIL36453.1 aldo/keto reductase [Cohnella kolymensis]
MDYRQLGKSGVRVSALGLGTNAFGSRADRAASIRIIHEALDSGINFIDTANTYSGTESERIIGEALAGRRYEAVLATKAGLPRGEGPNARGSSRYHIQQEIEGSLKRLNTDHIDLYQIHTFDPHTPLEETLRTLDDLIRAGKIRYIGASNYAAWELMKALGISDRLGLNRFTSIQPSYSLADRTPEQELVPLCLDQGVGIIPYFPLAGGLLSGKYTDVSNPPPGSRLEKNPDFAKRIDSERMRLGREVSRIAQDLNTTPAALSLSWLMTRPAVSTIIVGATRVEQLTENLSAASLKLDTAILEELERLSLPFRHGAPFAVFRI